MSQGEKITLGEREFTLLPCPAVGLKAIGRNFREIGTNSEAGIDALIDCIYYGIKRAAPNDADITRDFVEWNLDATNMEPLSIVVAQVNKAANKDEAQGEAAAGT